MTSNRLLLKIGRGTKELLRCIRSSLLWHIFQFRVPNYYINNSPSLIIAPHPDDESFGMGGLISLKRAAGARVSVIFLTRGEGSHEACRCSSQNEVAMIRRRQAIAATESLGVDSSDLYWLDVGDGKVPEASDARYSEVCQKIEDIIFRIRPAEVYCPLKWDGNRDHEAANKIIFAVANMARRPFCMVQYIVWGWYNPSWETVSMLAKSRRRRVDIRSQQGRKLAAIEQYLAADPAPCGQPYCGRLSGVLVRSCMRDFEMYVLPN